MKGGRWFGDRSHAENTLAEERLIVLTKGLSVWGGRQCPLTAKGPKTTSYWPPLSPRGGRTANHKTTHTSGLFAGSVPAFIGAVGEAIKGDACCDIEAHRFFSSRFLSFGA